MTRSVLVTGGGGFVGSHLVAGLVALGHAVTAVDRCFDDPTRERLCGATLIEKDLIANSGTGLPAADLVIHGAAITTPPGDIAPDHTAFIRTNLQLLRTTLDHAVSSGAADFVFLSSSGVFRPEDGAGIHLESTQPTADLPYARAKRAGEHEVAVAGGTLRAISVRLGPVYGPAEVARDTRTLVSPLRRWLDRVASNQPILLTHPAERRDWTFAPDLPHALLALLRGDHTGGVYHLTSGQVVSNLELARLVADLVPDTSIEIAPSPVAPRLPMGSDRLDLAALYGWTPLREGITLILEEARA